MAIIDKNYHKLLNTILKNGFKYEDPNRKGINRIQIPNYQFKHDFKDGFPAITTKKLYWKGVVGELLWFLRGDTNIKYLVDNNINIWNKDAYNYYLYKCKDGTQPISNSDFIKDIKENDTSRSILYRLGDLGRVYGAQWRKWKSLESENIPGTMLKARKIVFIDQISNLIKNLKEQPLATDHIVMAWNP